MVLSAQNSRIGPAHGQRSVGAASPITQPRAQSCDASCKPPIGTWFLIWTCVLAGLIQLGCLENNPSRTNPLSSRFRPRPIPAGPNGIYMDIVHLQRPFGDPELNRDLWLTADEEQLGFELRERLVQQGYRIALLGGPLPPVLKTLFNEEELGAMNGEHLQIQSGIPTQVLTGGMNSHWPNEGEDAEETDNDYLNAVAIFRVIPRITADACVDLAITPEIQYGEPRRQFVPNMARAGPLDWSIQVGRQSRLFEDLSFVLRLRPGQFALLGCYGNDRETLAARFFSRVKDGQTVQHVLLIRAEPSHEAVAVRSRHP